MSDFDEFDEDDIEIITMEDENGNSTEFLVIDSVEFKGVNFLLVIESQFAEDDEAEAVILKETFSDDGSCVYEVLEESEEFSHISSLFENSEDYEIEL